MAIIREAIDGRTLSSDRADEIVGTRTFMALNCPSVAAAELAFSQYPDALIFPDNERLDLYSYRISSEGAGAKWTIEAEYRPEKNLMREGWSYVKLQTPLPLVSPSYVTTATGNTELRTLVLGVEQKPIPEKRVRRTITIDYIINTNAELDPIAQQDGKIHLIFGRFYQFIGAETTQDARDRFKYTITYEWELDEGTPIPPGATVIQIPGEQSIEAVVLPEPANGETSPSLWRYPYSVPYLYQFDPKERPLYIPFFPYAIEPDGWRTLPGLVDL